MHHTSRTWMIALRALAAVATLAGCADHAELPSLSSPPEQPLAAVEGSDRTGLGTLGGTTSTAYDINGAGTVVGTSTLADGTSRAFRWTEAGGMVALPSGPTHAYGISASGLVAGRGVFGTSTRGYIWNPATNTVRQLPLGLPSASAGEAYDVNDAGQAVGYLLVSGKRQAVLWTPDASLASGYRTTALGDFGGGQGEAHGINRDGTVAGWALAGTGVRYAFRWTPGSPNGATGTMAALPGTRDSNASEAYDINDAGQITGSLYVYGRKPVRWDPGSASPVYLSGLNRSGNPDTYGESLALDSAGQRAAGVFQGQAQALAPGADGLALSAQGESAAHGISPDGAKIVGVAGGVAALWHNVITNTDPVASVGGDRFWTAVNQTITFDGRHSTDADGDPLTFTWLTSRKLYYAAGPTFSYTQSHVSPQQFYLAVTDDDGQSDTISFWVYVNTPPVAVIAGPDTVHLAEGQAYRFDGNQSYDANGHAIHHAWNTGDGATFLQPAVNRAYQDNGTYTAHLVVRDTVPPWLPYIYRADTAEVLVIVSNVAPTAVFPVGAGTEGTPRLLSLTHSFDPSATDRQSLQYAFDCGTGSGFGAFGSDSTAVCPAWPDQDTLMVQASVRDKDGGVTTYTRSQYIANVLPAVSAGASATSVRVGDLVTVAGSFTDPGADSSWTWFYDWGDGVTTRGGLPTAGALPPSGHRYAAAGTYTLLVRVRDDRGYGSATPVTITVSP